MLVCWVLFGCLFDLVSIELLLLVDALLYFLGLVSVVFGLTISLNILFACLRRLNSSYITWRLLVVLITVIGR